MRLEPALGLRRQEAAVFGGAVLRADQLVHAQHVAALLAHRERRELLGRAHAAVEEVREARLALVVGLGRGPRRLSLAPRARADNHCRQKDSE